MKFWNKPAILSAALWIFVALPGVALAGPVAFTKDWKILDFLWTPATEYKMNGNSVDITAKNSSSVIYSPLPKDNWDSTRASWSWATLQSVPPTDLSKKGGDDRNIALYFVYLDQKTALHMGQTADIKQLLTAKETRILIYIFGGNSPVGTILDNPYMDGRGKIIIKRPAAPGAFDEAVDLTADFRQAFGTQPQALVGVALASDSDDTDGLVLARVENLMLE